MVEEYKLRGYESSIWEATGVREPEQLSRIEDFMRNEIYGEQGGCLDWQSRAELRAAAREAWASVQAMEAAGVWNQEALGR